MDSNGLFLIQDISLIVVAATFATWILSIFKMPPMIGYILVGILLAPVLGVLKGTESISQLGEIGVMLMMFFVGMEFDLDRIKRVLAPSLWGVAVQIAFMMAFGFFTARMLELPSPNGLLLGSIFSLSSTIVTVEILSARGGTNKRFGQIAVGILILEDLFAILMMVVLSSIGAGMHANATQLFGTISQRALIFSTFVVSFYVFGKLATPYILRRPELLKNSQILIMFTFCVIMGLGEIAVSAGLSLAVGAFLAGSILSGTAVSGKIGQLTNPFRNLFVAIFFVSVGTKINPLSVLEMLPTILLISAGVIVLKTLACFIGTVIGGTEAKTAYLTSVSKAQVGEFGFVIAGIAISLGIGAPSLMTITMGVSFLSLLASPFLSAYTEPVIVFFGRQTPRNVKKFFKIYYHVIAVLSKSATNSPTLHKAFLPAMRVVVYAFIFNGILIFMSLLFSYLVTNNNPPRWIRLSIWGAAALASLPAIIGMLYNISECASIFATRAFRRISARAIKPAAVVMYTVSFVIAAAAAVVIYAFVLRFHFPNARAEIFYCAASAFFCAIGWRFVTRSNLTLQNTFTSIFKRHLKNVDHFRREQTIKNIREKYEWTTDIRETEITETAECAGKSVKDLSIRQATGAEIVAIRRSRFTIYNIMPDTGIYPKDIVVLSGEKAANDAAEKILQKQISENEILPNREIDIINVDELYVTAQSSIIGKTLAQANISKFYNVKIIGIRNIGQSALARPIPTQPLEFGMTMLALGEPDNIENFRNKFALQYRVER